MLGMKNFLIILLILIAGAVPCLAGLPVQAARLAQVNKAVKQATRPPNQKQQQQQLRVPNARGARDRVPIEDVVEGFYVSQFPVQVQTDDEQLVRILPLLRQGLRDLRQISIRKRRAMNQLAQMVLRDEPEENLKRMIQEIDKADEEYQTTQQRFYNSVDPHLTPLQQARFRVFQDRIDQRIRQMINSVTAPPGQ
jgi:hypothetical protein